MALIKSDKYVILCVQREISIYDVENKAHTSTAVPQLVRKQKQANGDENTEETNEAKEEGAGHITLSTVSSCGNLLAITTSGDKFIFIYKLHNGSLSLLANYQLIRASSAIRFTPDSKHLLVADKTGDCFVYECKENLDTQDGEGKWILGHCSMVLDILMTKCLKYVVTSDRDEKIRVTNFPQTEVIETYCLGHLEFVSAIEEISFEAGETILMSISGDKTLRLWNHFDGRELKREELSAPVLHFARNDENQFAIALLSETPSVGIYNITSSGKEVEITKVCEYTLTGNVKQIISMVFKSNDSIWLSCRGNDDDLQLIQLQVDGQTIVESQLDGTIDWSFQKKLHSAEDVTILFKKKFDNVSNYIDKKKRRLGNKNHNE